MITVDEILKSDFDWDNIEIDEDEFEELSADLIIDFRSLEDYEIIDTIEKNYLSNFYKEKIYALYNIRIYKMILT